MRLLINVLFGLTLLTTQSSFAATLDFLHPRDGGKANSSFQSVFKVVDTPPGRYLTVTLTLRDTETGDEGFEKTFEYLPEKKADTFVERVDASTFGEARETNLTITVRDKETGDELVSDTISFTMQEK